MPVSLFFTLPLPFLPVGQKQGLQQHQDGEIYMWAEAKKYSWEQDLEMRDPRPSSSLFPSKVKIT